MSDNTADSFDQASVVEQAFRDAAISAARASENKPADFDGENCYGCGLKIPIKRLDLGKFRCVECQTLREKSQRFNGG